jgi:hypothetical protein
MSIKKITFCNFVFFCFARVPVNVHSQLKEISMTESQQEAKKPKKAAWGCGILIALVVGLGWLGMTIPPTQTPSAPATNSDQPPVKVTAQTLFAAYQDNEAAAQQDYGDRPIEITGKVQSIDLGLGDEPSITLVTANQFMGVHLKLQSDAQGKAADVKKGQTLVALCASVTELAGTPFAKDCAF